MSKIKTVLLLVTAVTFGTLLTSSAYAQHRHRSHVGIWFGVPAPIYYPYGYYPRYYYPPPYYPPAYYAAPGPSYPTYIEQSPSAAAAPAPSQASSAYWYYCPDSKTYYPYVQQCASQWQQVVPQSGPPS
jgi:hypothetical protein